MYTLQNVLTGSLFVTPSKLTFFPQDKLFTPVNTSMGQIR